MKVALVYDRVNKWGGAEQILIALHRIFPAAPLYTSVYNPQSSSWAKEFKVKTSFLQNIPFARTSHEAFAPIMPIAFESFDFSSFDVVISITSEAAKGIITLPTTMHICICLTPTRYLWSGYDEYFSNILSKTISKPVVSYLRFWDLISSSRPDYFIAISQEVQSRIKKYYNKQSEIIYPPSLLEISKNFAKNEEVKPYFLVASRLVKYKKIDIAIEAAKKANVALKIVGEGRDRSRLESYGGSEIEFLGGLTDDRLSYYYRNCRALIFPGIEDFGLVMVEAQRHGKPVIAFSGGGAREIITPGVTGEFFQKQTPQNLAELLAKFDETKYNRQNCLINGERFSYKMFEKSFTKVFEQKVNEYFSNRRSQKSNVKSTP